MAIYRKVLLHPALQSPTTWTDLPGLSPIAIQAGQSDFSFVATLWIGGITIPTIPSNWGLSFRILQGSTVLGQTYMGTGNGSFSPQAIVVGVGDVAASGQTENVQAQWTSFGVQALVKEASSFSIVWDERLDG